MEKRVLDVPRDLEELMSGGNELLHHRNRGNVLFRALSKGKQPQS